MFEAIIEAASVANAITACADTSSPPAGTSPVMVGIVAALPAARPRLPISTSCDPMSPAAGSCDKESIWLLLLCVCARTRTLVTPP
ncbi:Uncharacterised protein [Mycobacterium tuberculosis]|uniref:Uncharacterized protein n=1 Tax=Mycobacterium tuberculosis TaxID=1773 RepID=A0A655JKG8_MYCTX|nr:Uncharacterised protein [Mycobacterium tuberculosis]CKS89996.1 Uncharacterised protein [Mycobacterium tuberculosis]COW04472.1 Uncharacterised protein [Mycobacterium tuberculosis]COX08803.1 Uncharacterised protein [Mycobacterium tuberculosis]